MTKTKTRTKNVIMTADQPKGMKIFEVVIGVVAFVTFYMILVTAVSTSAPYLLGALVGAAVVGVYLTFKRRLLVKLITLGGVVIYTALCIAIGFKAFVGGAAAFWNNLVANANAHMHWGIGYASGEAQGVSEFLFCSVASAWLGLAFSAVCAKRSLYYVIGSAVIVVVWMCLGLYPSVYVVALFAVTDVATLIAERGFSVKAAMCYLLCAAVFFSTLIPCVLYQGSGNVVGFRNSVSTGFDKLLYGEDSLPEGNLLNSSGMRKSADTKLIVGLSAATPILYLKGFVGSEFNGNAWSVTDKNVYVADGYQGLLDYVKVEQIPTAQFARYAAVSHNDNRYDVSVTNVSANRKYVYAPYSVISYDAGSPYYDLGLQGNLFTAKSYNYKIFSTDRSSERVTQARWLLSESNRTAQQRQYMDYEKEYRAFVNHVYGKSALDEETSKAIASAYNFSGNSINTATQLIRAYFSSRFTYSDEPEALKDDFVDEFFGGKLSKANSAYFATAATLIYRKYGFAARYVEGYLVRYTGTDDVSDLQITGNNAHAWTEVYFDGMGWLPIEVTPTYFSEDNDEQAIDPTDPNVPEEPVEPIIPPIDENPSKPPKEPDEEPEIPLTPEQQRLLVALKAVLPVLCVLLAIGALLCAILLRRNVTLTRKNKSLAEHGEQFGRSAYTIIAKDCKHFGGFTADNLEQFGIAKSATERCMQLLEKSVYSGDDLSVNEKRYVKHYIEQMSNAIANSKGKRHKLYCKYIRCLGL